MKIEHIGKKIQEANHNIIETYNYFTHYKYDRINEYLQNALNSAIKTNKIITNIIVSIKGIEDNMDNTKEEIRYE